MRRIPCRKMLFTTSLKMPHEINAEFVFGQLAVGKELEPLSISEMEQLKLWLKRMR